MVSEWGLKARRPMRALGPGTRQGEDGGLDWENVKRTGLMQEIWGGGELNV